MNPSNTFTYFLIPKRWYVGTSSTCPFSSSVIIQIYNFNKQ